ncbi:hypothetical protein DMX12_04080 [Pseudomonas sp. MB-090624]|nr:hypothetical protein DMX12_04080 [Pseudomonas sp. MB-090624]
MSLFLSLQAYIISIDRIKNLSMLFRLLLESIRQNVCINHPDQRRLDQNSLLTVKLSKHKFMTARIN